MSTIEDRNFQAGDYVTYHPFGGKERGRVKLVSQHNPTAVFVVYRCDNNWDNYQNYTGAATNVSDLTKGWPE